MPPLQEFSSRSASCQKQMLVGKILDIFGFDVDGAPLFLTLIEGVDFMVVGKLIFFAPILKSGRKKGNSKFSIPVRSASL